MNLTKYKKKYKEDRFYREVFVERAYGPVFDKKKDVVLDVGACAGEFSFWIEGGTVYAIEPENDHYKELIENIEEVDAINVKPFNLALAGENGAANLQVGTRGGAALKGEGGQQTITKTLSTFMKENDISHIDIMKIDVEDGEGGILNAPDFKDVADKISYIIGEHLGGLAGLLESHGFKVITQEGHNILFGR